MHEKFVCNGQQKRMSSLPVTHTRIPLSNAPSSPDSYRAVVEATPPCLLWYFIASAVLVLSVSLTMPLSRNVVEQLDVATYRFFEHTSKVPI